ncbi:MAG: 3-methyl-2-oxobutanoate hydroxymethyltransferase [Brucellaceae bacterium]|nr:3-methyl-2-oxobutanoate hydroxymethyltransferase [Brucellaceae bacterium]
MPSGRRTCAKPPAIASCRSDCSTGSSAPTRTICAPRTAPCRPAGTASIARPRCRPSKGSPGRDSGRLPCRTDPVEGNLDRRLQGSGKTAESAFQVYRHVKDLENAGAFAAEIEVVPARVTAEISTRTTLLMLSMGAARAATHSTCSPRTSSATRGHRPRHARTYRDFRAEYDRLQREARRRLPQFIGAMSATGAIRRKSIWFLSPRTRFDAFVEMIGRKSWASAGAARLPAKPGWVASRDSNAQGL